MTYVFSEEWDRERKRLAGIEAAADLVSSDVLSRLDVGPGWRCAEVGAGGGSLAQWLADRVGDTGQVVATDLDPGYLTTEAGDWSTRYEITSSAVFEAVLVAVQELLASAGFAPMFGRRLPVLLLEHGLVDVGCEARSRMLRGGTPEMGFFTLTIERVRTAMVAAGLIDDDDVAAALDLCADPSFAVMSPALVSAWGRCATG